MYISHSAIIVLFLLVFLKKNAKIYFFQQEQVGWQRHYIVRMWEKIDRWRNILSVLVFSWDLLMKNVWQTYCGATALSFRWKSVQNVLKKCDKTEKQNMTCPVTHFCCRFLFCFHCLAYVCLPACQPASKSTLWIVR